jgi:hypothetical protein
MAITVHFPRDFFADWRTVSTPAKAAFYRFLVQFVKNPDSARWCTERKYRNGQMVYTYEFYDGYLVYYDLDRQQGIFPKRANFLSLERISSV